MPKAKGMTVLPTTQVPSISEQAPPVQNTWYPVLTHIGKGILSAAAIYQDNDENAAKNCQIRITVDGTVINTPNSLSIADAAWRYWYVYRHLTGSALYYSGSSSGVCCIFSFYQEIRWKVSILVEMRMVDAVGTNQIMNMDCAWHEVA